jgi:hypothetical protein
MNDAVKETVTEAGEAVQNDASNDVVKTVVTIGVIAGGAALIEAALIPGMIVGAAAILAPKYLPQIGDKLQPLFRSSVRGIYKFNRKVREKVAEAHEQMQDVVAEIHAEEGKAAEAPAEA